MSLISGNVTFNSGSINYSANANVIVGESNFCGNARNCGLISSGYFFDTAINVGIISCDSIFAGNSINSGTASIAVFSGNSINCSSVTTCAIFVDTAVNAASVTYASFCGSAVNNGIVSQSGLFYGSAVNSGSVCGNAIFADTASNAVGATVCGGANFATGSYNGGTVVGATGVYTPPSAHGDGAYGDGYYTNGVIDGTYSSSTPVQAQDDNKWYTYSNGDSDVVVSGAYEESSVYWSISNGEVVYNYPSGVQILVNTANAGYYYNFNPLQPILPNSRFNGAIEVNSYWFSIVDGVKEATATFNGAGIGQPSNAYYPIVNGALNNGVNAIGVLMNAHDGLYYNFSGGGGLPVSSFNGAVNINNAWFSVVDGVKESTATFDGFYEISANIFVTIEDGTQTGTSAIGVFKSVNDGLYYYISSLNNLNGLANNYFSIGCFFNGVISPVTNTGKALDNDLWYVYVDGLPIGFPGINVILLDNQTEYVSINSSNVAIGTFTVYSNGDGTTYNTPTNYSPSGTVIYDDTTVYHYKSDGVGGYNQYYRPNHIITSGSNPQLSINAGNWDNGTYQELADGDGGSSIVYDYPEAGFVFTYNETDHWVADGNGGFNQYLMAGQIITDNVANTININGTDYPNGTYDVVANGSGGSSNVYTYAEPGVEFYNDSSISYRSDGNGGYTEVPMI
jgi:hypothetical protein